MAYVSPVYACARGRGRIHARTLGSHHAPSPFRGRGRRMPFWEFYADRSGKKGYGGSDMNRSTPAPYMIRLTPSAAPHW